MAAGTFFRNNLIKTDNCECYSAICIKNIEISSSLNCDTVEEIGPAYCGIEIDQWYDLCLNPQNPIIPTNTMQFSQIDVQLR
jgi:hypothetical protein